MPNESEDFAKQISDGTLSFSNLEGCDAELSVNENSLIIRYNQLFLLRQDRKAGSPYLSYWPFLDSSAFSQGKRDAIADSLATGILSSIPIENDLENELIPKPQGQDQVLEKKRILIQKNIIAPKEGVSANQIHTEYRKYIEQRTQTELAPIHNIFAGVLGISRQDFKISSKLSKTIATRLLDPFY